MTTPLLKVVAAQEARLRVRQPFDAQTAEAARRIVDDVAARGRAAVVEHAQRLGDLRAGEPLIYDRAALRAALDALEPGDRRALERVAGRISAFASAQRTALLDVDVPVLGGRAGHRFMPVTTAGCYAPGGRYPLPSSVLMTALTARAAGVRAVWTASPRPSTATLAAAAIADADALLGVGGAQAIAALAIGIDGVPACDAVVGPGNRYVTAAKHVVSDRVRIDMLAGPSEVLIIADDGADPSLVAADILAQAEHDDDAIAILLTTSSRLAADVERELARQLETLPTAATARRALASGYACILDSLDAAADLADHLAPEHLELMTRNDDRLASRVSRYGTLFIGGRSGEALGDYGVGPNHTLPTGGSARYASGLSVLTFLNARTWVRLDGTLPAELIEDTVAMARMEGLEAHARAAIARAR